jgi:bis(5'-nucleosyl)-tetraphosphatase (symmetrical)
MATYVIGDIQGCYKTLRALLKHCHFNPEHDHLWLVGDIINRGSGSLEVLLFLHDLKDRVSMVLGNHDLHLLAVFAGLAPLKKGDTLEPILNHREAETLYTWLRYQPLLHHDIQLNAVMTHAGLYPLWDLTIATRLAQEVEALLQSDHYIEFFKVLYGNHPDTWQEELTGFDRARFIVNAFTRMRVVNPQGQLELNYKGALQQIPNGYSPWFEFPVQLPSNTRLLFGHWAQCVLPLPYNNLFLLDTGCVWGRQLTAVRLEDEKIFCIESQE